MRIPASIVFPACALLSACGSEQRSVAADSLAVVQLRERFAEAHRQSDLEAVLSTLDTAFVLMPPNGPPLVGWDPIRAWLQPSFDRYRWDYTYPSDELRVAGDWAYDRGSFAGTLWPKGGGTPIRSQGDRLWILRRQSDGGWRLTHVMFSRHAPPPTKGTPE